MVNAIVSDLVFSKNIEEIAFVLSYLRQLHFLQGFERIFLPRTAFDAIKESATIEEDKFLESIDKPTKSESALLKECEMELSSILWTMKRTDIHEAQLSSLLSLYSTWLQAKRQRSVIVQAALEPTSPFSRLIHLLAGEQKEFIGHLADDIELWFLSHFGDLYTEWPFFLSFSKDTARTLQKNDYYRDFFGEFVDLRTKTCGYSASKHEFTKRAIMLSEMVAYSHQILRLAKEMHGKEIILYRASLAVSNETITGIAREAWRYQTMAKFFKDEAKTTDQTFLPCFAYIKHYPLRLLKSMKPHGPLTKKTNPLVYHSLFETAQEAELELVLSSFKKRLKVNDTFETLVS
jgi:hypothetical protein